MSSISAQASSLPSRRREAATTSWRCDGRAVDGLAVVRMQAAGEHRLAAPGDAVRHQHGLGAGGRAVVHRGVRHLHAGEQRHLGLELEQVLQRALGDLRLIGRVGGEELAALDQVIDGRRHVVAVGAGADEERHRAGRDDVLRRHRRARARPPSRPGAAGRSGRQPRRFRHVAEQVVDRGNADRASIGRRSASVSGR